MLPGGEEGELLWQKFRSMTANAIKLTVVCNWQRARLYHIDRTQEREVLDLWCGVEALLPSKWESGTIYTLYWV